MAAASEQQAITAKQMAKDVTLVLDCTREQLQSADSLNHLFGRIEANSSTIQQRIGNFTIEATR